MTRISANGVRRIPFPFVSPVTRRIPVESSVPYY